MPSPTSITVPTLVVRTAWSLFWIWSRSARTMSSDRIPIFVLFFLDRCSVQPLSKRLEASAHAVVSNDVLLADDQSAEDLGVDLLGQHDLSLTGCQAFLKLGPLLIAKRHSGGDGEALDAQRPVGEVTEPSQHIWEQLGAAAADHDAKEVLGLGRHRRAQLLPDQRPFPFWGNPRALQAEPEDRILERPRDTVKVVAPALPRAGFARQAGDGLGVALRGGCTSGHYRARTSVSASSTNRRRSASSRLRPTTWLAAMMARSATSRRSSLMAVSFSRTISSRAR